MLVRATLRIPKTHDLSPESLHLVTQATTLSRLLYASPAWYGYTVPIHYIQSKTQRALFLESSIGLDFRGLAPLFSGGDLAPSLGGRKFFRGPRFLNDVFSGKNVNFHAQNFL